MRAYETLMAEGWVKSRPASGMFVAASEPVGAARVEASPAGAPGRSSWSMPLPALPNPPASPAAHRRGRLSHDFAPGRAHPALFPLKAWRRLLLKQLARGGSVDLTDAADPAGLPSLRSAIAARLAITRGLAADPARILVSRASRKGSASRRAFSCIAARPRPLRTPARQARRWPSRRPAPKLSAWRWTPTDSFPMASRSAQPPFSTSRPRISFQPATCFPPNGARPSRPGRGAAAAIFSRRFRRRVSLRRFADQGDRGDRSGLHDLPRNLCADARRRAQAWLHGRAAAAHRGGRGGQAPVRWRRLVARAGRACRDDAGAELLDACDAHQGSLPREPGRPHRRAQAQFRRGQRQRRGWRPAPALALAAGRSGRRRRRSPGGEAPDRRLRAPGRCRSSRPCSTAGRS